MKTEIFLDIYEVDRVEQKVNMPKLKLSSHFCYKRDRINLEINGQVITVLIDELIKAAENCRNTL